MITGMDFDAKQIYENAIKKVQEMGGTEQQNDIVLARNNANDDR